MAAGGNASAGDIESAAPELLSPHTRYAIKTALSLTLAYMLPMAMGWPQPQTAATTVMLIAATGTVAESLQKGVMRLLGTLAGAVIGLTLIALFPQERMVYLLLTSIVVSLLIYLYNAYQGDSTAFMLTAVVTLMVFNGGDAEGAFLYGVDRAFMTAFGVLVYTVVASLLWPVAVVDNIRELALEVAQSLRASLDLLRDGQASAGEDPDVLLTKLIASREAFAGRLLAGKADSETVKAYAAEWRTINAGYRELECILAPAMHNRLRESPDYHRYLDDYGDAVTNVHRLVQSLEDAWIGRIDGAAPEIVAVRYREPQLLQASHRVNSIVATRANTLNRVQELLVQLNAAVRSLVSDQGGFNAATPEPTQSRFIWRDVEAVKTAIRAFVTFWTATAIWILFNPPGGFMFVTLSTVLIPLVSYTPATPKLLVILLSLGFFFALPAYVLLLPALSHWIQLAAFIFLYAFAGYMVFKGPVSIFYLLGLFTLGIQNEMNYSFNLILLIMLMFYLVCALLVISVYFPFTSNPAKLFAGLKRRFFVNASDTLQLLQQDMGKPSTRLQKRLQLGDSLIGKMRAFGQRIPADQYRGNTQEAIAAYIASCETLQGELHILALQQKSGEPNPLVQRARRRGGRHLLVGLSEALAYSSGDRLERRFSEAQQRVTGVEQALDKLLRQEQGRNVDRDTLSGFYLYLNLNALLLSTLFRCRETVNGLDWRELRENRF